VLSSLAFHLLIWRSNLYAAIVEITDISKMILQIYSQCNVYEAGDKKKTFEFYTEKVKYICLLSMFAVLSSLVRILSYSQIDSILAYFRI